MPDQFRPGRDTPASATPTCCCCCCCCVVTIVTAAVVIPMRMELAERRAAAAGVPGRVGALGKLAGFLAPPAAVGAGVWTAMVGDGLTTLALPVAVVVFVALVAWGYRELVTPARVLGTTALFVVGIVAELPIGARLLIDGNGGAYVLLGIVVLAAMVGRHLALLRRAAEPR
jgi:hypothetical protein